MKPECPKFDEQRAAKALEIFGYTSIPVEVSEVEIRAFAAHHSATVERGMMNWMVKLSTEPDPKDRAAYFEKVRQENMARRSKLAANRKKKEATK